MDSLSLPPWQMLLVVYAVAFGLQNKCTFLYGISDFADRLLRCTYCLGTHSGWLSWLAAFGMAGQLPLPTWWQNVLNFVVGALCGAAFSYALDAGIRWFESHTPEAK